MEVLPPEIWSLIIGYLNRKQLLSIRLVSKSWQILAEGLMRTMYFSLKNDTDVLNYIKIASWRNVENTILPPLPFMRFIIYPNLKLNTNLKVFFTKYGYGNVIESLRFEETDQHENYDSIFYTLTTPTPSVQEKEIYCMNEVNPVVVGNSFQLNLPKLKILEFGIVKTGLLEALLNLTPNLQQLKFETPREANRWDKFITVLQLIATRSINVKLIINISSEGINALHLTEIAEIPLRIIELKFFVNNTDAWEDLDSLQKLIKKFIQQHSKNLKYLKVHFIPDPNTRKRLTLDHKGTFLHLNYLQKLELSCNLNGRLQFNLGTTVCPLLNEIKITEAEVYHNSLISLRHLSIDSDTACEYLNRLRLNDKDKTIRLQKVCLRFLKNKGNLEADARVQRLNTFFSSEGEYIKELYIEAGAGQEMDKLQFPKMKKLQRLKLKLYNMGMLGKLKLQQPHFPNLQILTLDTPLQPNPDSNECMENVHTLIVMSDSLCDFKYSGLKFPKLRNLYISGDLVDKSGILNFVFTSMAHVEQLAIRNGGTWNEFTGNSEFVDEQPSTSTKIPHVSIRNCNSTVANLGDMTALRSLTLGYTDFNDLQAVPYLISNGKLISLKYFEAKVSYGSKELISPIVKTIQSNGTATCVHYTLMSKAEWLRMTVL